jgi:hypothetical protein
MPKRMIEGEGIWLSDKIAKLPEKFRAEYANILPLALADGIFECEPRRVWCTVYAYNRPEITVEYVTEMLNLMEDVGLIVRAEHEGHKWAFFIGIDKPGRLPEPSKRGRYTTSGLHPDIIRTMFGQLLQSANRNGKVGSQLADLGQEGIKRLLHERSAQNKGHK